MKFLRARDFTADTAWGKEILALFGNVGVKVHWTDQPYKWHTNTGKEVFVVLDGIVDMHYRDNHQEHIRRMEAGDILSLNEGEEHVAHPIGEARILVVEDMNSD